MINVGGDDVLVFQDEDKSLLELGFRNETEVSYFNKADYEKYKLDPTLKWWVFVTFNFPFMQSAIEPRYC